MSPYRKGLGRGDEIAFTDNWHAHLEQSLWFQGWGPLLCNTSTTCGGWSLETHRIRFPWVSRSINPYRFLIKRDTGLGQLESFLVYFRCMMAASVGWTPSLLGTTLHSSAKTSTGTTDTAGSQRTWRNLILDGCAYSLDSKSPHQAFLQSHVSLSRKTLQGL